jgi:hypothetical protein
MPNSALVYPCNGRIGSTPSSASPGALTGTPGVNGNTSTSDPSGLTMRILLPVNSVGPPSVNVIFCGLETCTEATLAPSIDTVVALLKPVPSISITAPLGNKPPPGVTLAMDSVPPMVTVPALTETA